MVRDLERQRREIAVRAADPEGSLLDLDDHVAEPQHLPLMRRPLALQSEVRGLRREPQHDHGHHEGALHDGPLLHASHGAIL